MIGTQRWPNDNRTVRNLGLRSADEVQMPSPRHAGRQSGFGTWWQRTPARRRGWELLLLPIIVALVVGSAGPSVSEHLKSHADHQGLDIMSARAYGDLGYQKIDVIVRNGAELVSAITKVILTFVGYRCPPAAYRVPPGSTYEPDAETAIPSSEGSFYVADTPPHDEGRRLASSLAPTLSGTAPLVYTVSEKVAPNDLDRFQLSLRMLEARFPLIINPTCSSAKALFKMEIYYDGISAPIDGPYVGVKVDWYYQALRAQETAQKKPG